MKMSFTVEMSDGTKHKAVTAFADLIALEDEFDMDASDFGVRQRGVWLAFLAWHALKRRKVIDMSFADFRDQLEVLDVEGDENADGDQGNA